MRTCWESFEAYAFRALGREFGERLLPRGLDITFCDQVFLIGSGLIWNVYFAAVAIAIGFGLAVAVAMARFSENPWLSRAAAMFIFVFRGSPLFIQFFFFYSAFVLLQFPSGIDIPMAINADGSTPRPDRQHKWTAFWCWCGTHGLVEPELCLNGALQPARRAFLKRRMLYVGGGSRRLGPPRCVPRVDLFPHKLLRPCSWAQREEN